MRNSIALGLSVGMVAGFCIIAAGVLSYVPQLADHRRFFVGGWFVLAVVLLVARRKRVVAEAAAEVVAEADSEPDAGEFVTSPRYWALMASIFGVLSLFVTPWDQLKEKVAARTSHVSRPAKTNHSPARVTNEVRAVWPSLRLQGVAVNGPRSTAIINGKTYQLGERMDSGPKVIAITHTSVTLENQDETRQLGFALH